MDIEKAISLENLNQYKKNTSEKIKSYVDTKTSVIQDGTKTVGGISTDDYNAFKSAVEDSHIHSNMSVLDEIDESVVKGGNSLSGSTSYTVTDSVDYPLVGLKVYGKSEQKQYSGKNLINATLGTTTQNGVTCTKNADGTYTLNGTATADTVFYLTGENTLNKNVPYKLVGCPKNGSSSTYKLDLFDDVNKLLYPDFGEGKILNFEENKVLSNTRIVVYSGAACNNLVFKPMLTTDLTATYDDYEPYVGGIPSPNPDYPQEITSVVEPTITVSNDTKSASMTLPYTLNAIPVSSGGNVTIDGQKYIADYVDFEKRVKVQNTVEYDLGSLNWNMNNSSGRNQFYASFDGIPSSINLGETRYLITNYKKFYGNSSNFYAKDKVCTLSNSYVWGEKLVILDDDYTNASDFKNSMVGQKIICFLETPIETLLSESELQAYRQLQTYNGTSNISNDKGAGLSVEYCTSKMLAEYALPLIKDLEVENAKKDEEISALKTDILNNEKIHNRIYEGVNLSEKFASEIAASPYNGDVWAWINARITAEDFTGIHVGDYIPFTTTNGVTLNAQIAGINTYKNYGDNPVGAHIDFICKELWGTTHPINKVNYNNGTTNQNHPWLASDLYLYLNSLSGSVPNGTAVNPETIEVDYTTDGVYYYLPEALKSVIKEKRFILSKRYSASGLLTDNNQWGWTNIGKLWLPDECEVYGAPIWGGKGFSAGSSGLQYPLFAGNMNRLKFRNGSRYHWWLLSPCSGNSSDWCIVDGGGSCAYSYVSHGYIAAPVCFRV